MPSSLLAGDLTLDEFLHQAGDGKTADLGEVQLDLDRSRRCGFPEVIFAEGKTTAAMEKIFLTLLEQGADVLATRMSADQAEELLPKFPSANYNPIGRTFRIPLERAGTSSSPAEEDRKAKAAWRSSPPARAICRWPRKPARPPFGRVRG